MKESQKGITLVSLAITIIVILIIAGITIYTGTDIIESANLQTIDTDLLLIQAKIKTISEKSDFEGNEEGYVGDPLTDEMANKIGFDGNRQKARTITKQEQLNSLGLTKIDLQDGYVIDYEKEEIYYVKGYEAKDGNTYYKLSAIESINR